MKNVLIFIGGFIAGIVSIFKFIFKIVNNPKINSIFANGIKDMIVCWVSSLLYGGPDHLYVRRDHTSYYDYFKEEKAE